ncbi:MAG: serine hydrolase [Chloroflexota bacterium]|nr:serine hydrolase [Chloroflexota bacterium]MDE2947101.1 serine hydrolase [Chloroflexota bacterium]
MGASLSSRRRQTGFPVLVAFSALLLLAASALFVYELVAFSRREQQLPEGISVAGINVGGLSEREAVARWERAYAEPIIMLYNDGDAGHPIQLHPDQVGWRISSEPMLAAASASGEEGGGFWRRFLDFLLGIEQTVARDMPLIADYQENALEAFLRDIAQRYDKPPGRASYDLQSLTVQAGSSGYSLNVSAAQSAVNSALRSADARTVALPIVGSGQERPDLPALQNLIIDFLDSRGFIYDGLGTVASIYVQDLVTGDEINILGDVAFSGASTVKLPIMLDFYRLLSSEPTTDEAWLMVNSMLCSNNASSNLIMEIIGRGDIFTGLRSVSNTLQEIGVENTYITAPFYLGVAGQQLGSIQAPATAPNPNFDTEPDPFNQTTAEDMGTLFSLLYDCAEYNSGLTLALPSGQVTQRECRQMLEIASANDLERLLQGGIPTEARISHKNGWIFDTVGDAGVVYSPNGRHYVISVFLWERTEFQDYEKLWPLIEEISRATWNFFNPESALPQPRSNLPPTAMECEGNYLPPGPDFVNLSDINSWKRN